ncbi:MAG: TIGR02266 family protein [bacterium]
MGRRELLRIDAKVEVVFKSFDQFYREYTKNISKGGLFIKTRNPLKPQTVIEINLKLPEREDPLNLVGEVVHVIDPETADAQGWDPGIGVQFVDFEEGAHQELEEYVASLYKEEPDTRTEDRRRHSRRAVRLKVRFPSEDVLQQDYSEDMSRGGIFIQTNKARQVGDQFILTLVHPTTGRELEIPGEVVRVSTEDPQVPGSVTGMGIRFLEMDREKHKAIEEFLGLAPPVK